MVMGWALHLATGLAMVLVTHSAMHGDNGLMLDLVTKVLHPDWYSHVPASQAAQHQYQPRFQNTALIGMQVLLLLTATEYNKPSAGCYRCKLGPEALQLQHKQCIVKADCSTWTPVIQ
jgi:hypothetical protein